MQLQEYKLVIAFDAESLNTEVNELLLEGWRLYKAPVLAVGENGGIRLGQALIREKEIRPQS